MTKYVVEITVETNRKLTKKLVREVVASAMEDARYNAISKGQNVITKARVRKVDID
jgi:hypothetical protein